MGAMGSGERRCAEGDRPGSCRATHLVEDGCRQPTQARHEPRQTYRRQYDLPPTPDGSSDWMDDGHIPIT